MMLLVDSTVECKKLAQTKMHVNLTCIIKSGHLAQLMHDFTSIDALEIQMTCTTRHVTLSRHFEL